MHILKEMIKGGSSNRADIHSNWNTRERSFDNWS